MERIWLSSPHMSGHEQQFVKEAFDTNWVAPLGPNVDGFESDLSKYLKTGNVAALSSGTAAIHLALLLLGVQTGDEVIASSFTFSATVNPITYIGAIPVLIDSEKQTWNMDPQLLEEAIKDRIEKGKKPKAVIAVHLYGMPAHIEDILNVCNRYEIPLIEDAAESLGSKYKEKATGTFGVMSILSFNGNKIITTSGGGALISDNKEFIQKSRFLATQARDDAPHYQHSHIGYNYRMSNVLAGIGRGQLMAIEERVQQRRKNNKFYRNQFSDIEELSFLSEPNNNFYSNYWLTTITVEPKNNTTRETIRLALEKENIEARPLWKPMHCQPIFEHCPAYVNGTSQSLFEKGLCLPSGSNLTEEQLNRVVKIVKGVF